MPTKMPKAAAIVRSKYSAPNIDVLKELQAAQKALAPALRRVNSALQKLNPKKLPVGTLADLLYDIRATGKMLGTITAPFDETLQSSVKAIEEHFINTLAVGESSGVQGMRSRVQITENSVPVVADWTKFYAHIKKTGSFELLNRAVNRESVKERWELKKQVPGVTAFHAKKVSCTVLRGKGGA